MSSTTEHKTVSSAYQSNKIMCLYVCLNVIQVEHVSKIVVKDHKFNPEEHHRTAWMDENGCNQNS